jgi:hypothetical protein
MAAKTIATATVRALKGRKLLPTRAALTLVRTYKNYFIYYSFTKNSSICCNNYRDK